MKKIASSLLTILILTLLVSACSDGKKLKEQLMNAYGKQTEMQNYSFSGKAKLSSDETPTAKNPLTSPLLALIKQSAVTWQGTASSDPVRLESKLSVAPEGTDTTWEIPLLIKDNKMYVHLPVVNKPEEFFQADLQELSAFSKQNNPFTPEKVKQASQISSTLMKDLITVIDPKSFGQGKQAADSEFNTVKIVIEPKNWQTFQKALSEQLPQFSETLKNAGFPITDQTVSDWKAKLGTSVLNQPLEISVSMDKDGFVRRESINLDATATDAQSKPFKIKLQMENAYDNINQNPAFTMKIPENTKSLTDLFKLLLPAAK